MLWALNKDKNSQVDLHGKIVLNWFLSSLIYFFVSSILCFIVVGFFMLLGLVIIAVVFPIIGAIKANDGILWKYPLSITFFT